MHTQSAIISSRVSYINQFHTPPPCNHSEAWQGCMITTTHARSPSSQAFQGLAGIVEGFTWGWGGGGGGSSGSSDNGPLSYGPLSKQHLAATPPQRLPPGATATTGVRAPVSYPMQQQQQQDAAVLMPPPPQQQQQPQPQQDAVVLMPPPPPPRSAGAVAAAPVATVREAEEDRSGLSRQPLPQGTEHAASAHVGEGTQVDV